MRPFLRGIRSDLSGKILGVFLRRKQSQRTRPTGWWRKPVDHFLFDVIALTLVNSQRAHQPLFALHAPLKSCGQRWSTDGVCAVRYGRSTLKIDDEGRRDCARWRRRGQTEATERCRERNQKVLEQSFPTAPAYAAARPPASLGRTISDTTQGRGMSTVR